MKQEKRKTKIWRRNQQNEIRTITFSFPLKYLEHSNAHKHTIKGDSERWVCMPGKRYEMAKYKSIRRSTREWETERAGVNEIKGLKMRKRERGRESEQSKRKEKKARNDCIKTIVKRYFYAFKLRNVSKSQKYDIKHCNIYHKRTASNVLSSLPNWESKAWHCTEIDQIFSSNTCTADWAENKKEATRTTHTHMHTYNLRSTEKWVWVSESCTSSKCRIEHVIDIISLPTTYCEHIHRMLPIPHWLTTAKIFYMFFFAIAFLRFFISMFSGLVQAEKTSFHRKYQNTHTHIQSECMIAKSK